MYLNQPLILLLEHLGVDGQYLFLLQQNAIAEVSTVRTCLPDASRAFSQHGLGASFRLPSLFQNLRSQLNLDLKVTGRPVIRHQLVDSCLWFGVTHILREIKYRARIPVPGSYTLIGVPDEWDCLNEGEIFATIFDPRTGDLLPIEGRVVVTRSPQLHPGDLQLVQAVRRTQLEHLRNVVVFPSKGFRSMPSMLAGGDLDGDIFNLILDPKLHSHYNATPASYEGLPDKVVPSPCTVDDVARFFVDYVKSDLLGYISILHRRCADVGSPSDDICVQLAEHASHAVDYPKTGAAVNFRDLPRPPSREKPDFLAAEGVDPTNHPAYYPSPKILGRLFRNVPMEADSMDEEEYLEPTAASVIRTALRGIDTTALDLPPLSQPSDDDLSPMRDLFEAYIDQLRTIAHAHSLSTYYRLSEGELVSGMIHARWTDRRRRQRSVAMMNIETQELAKAVRRELYGDDGGDVNEVVAQHDDDRVRRRGSFTRAYAAWLVSEEILESDPGAFGPQSFGLIALGVLLEMVKQSRQMVYGSAW
ncbi:hypothetical protein JAAARDRAFT_693519 [Jaapia argillacea MUCL 33604]|uniref:RNA-dependent RNA polymerase n=1 Tax=Jaapia argillacea MUCL 33604 TaxID=933084 RepID=A0A067PM95_9AGAM|nr:hypothetical protein JAAARDRAFT_693519 [Jaapia argillacea MUCL 33604]